MVGIYRMLQLRTRNAESVAVKSQCSTDEAHALDQILSRLRNRRLHCGVHHCTRVSLLQLLLETSLQVFGARSDSGLPRRWWS